MPVQIQRIDRCGKGLCEDNVGARKTLAVSERSAIVNHGDVKSEHRAQLAQRLRDMAGPDDNQTLSAGYRIDENALQAIGFDMSHGIEGSCNINFEQCSDRVGSTFRDLL